ncbi:hypothetical protein RO3G_08207 [Rhizopus delemar RA 99-880]|uniref:Uncharacterized protein n=1 Tax=Rhizopus delemar (strain RA 99-880 / ATCC MYA-4621 / FGSC 9543 / NRRL 43880) TaxID=246409 RepID=I1C4X2_RHIO9|nr:hypothetical protein RO3G_08207 [Rhizopus delemar RA 99-880]|eukprot:EIE83502.1 hypothetical protein RO3G_08207 [Rhizopus delemar RA 99-880]
MDQKDSSLELLLYNGCYLNPVLSIGESKIFLCSDAHLLNDVFNHELYGQTT